MTLDRLARWFASVQYKETRSPGTERSIRLPKAADLLKNKTTIWR
jgi:hypothetical protein